MTPLFIEQRGFAGATVNIEQRLNGLRGFGFGRLGEPSRNVTFDPVTVTGSATHTASHGADATTTRAAGGDIGLTGDDGSPAPRVMGGVSVLLGAAGLYGGYRLYKGGHPVAGVIIGLIFGAGPVAAGSVSLVSGKTPY